MLVTLAETIVTMSQDFEILSEVPLVPAEGTVKPVRLTCKELSTTEVAQHTKLDLAVPPVISWREDGDYFAISTFENGLVCT